MLFPAVRIVVFVLILIVFALLIHRMRRQRWLYHPATALGLGLMVGFVAYIMFHVV